MDSDAIYRVLKYGTPAERQEFARGLPPSGFKDMAVSMLDTDSPGMVVVALGSAVIGYCNGGAPAAGAPLAAALHRYAVELFQGTPDHGLMPTTLTNLAVSYVQASNLLGRSQDVVDFTTEYIPFYEKVGETVNLPSLKLGRIAALLNLNRLDDAARELEDATLPGNPVTDIELARLKERLRQLRAPITEDRSRAKAQPGPVGDDFVALAQAALVQVTTGLPEEARLKELIGKLGEKPRSDPSNPAGFAQILSSLRMGEAVLRGGGTEESELTVRGRIREATAIFALQKRPAKERIRKSLGELEQSLSWARANRIIELENDALYGIYLCHGRLKNPSPAADALLRLRGNLEEARSNITDVVKRGGAFSLYPQLFPALCEKLHDAGRIPEMFEAIEASKGRGVADLLTVHSGKPVADASIYAAVGRVPELCRQHDFHYVSYLVDDERTYVILVTRDGQIHAPEPVPLSRTAIRDAASLVDPKAADLLSSLVAWLEPFLADGSVAPGEHLCIAADDDLANVPFSYLPLRGRPLAETISTSRIHNAFHLDHLLEVDAHRPKSYVGVVVGTRQNAASKTWSQMHANLLKPIGYLAQALSGETLDGASASTEALSGRKLSGCVVHFSTHGMFPKNEAPFQRSGLILADGHSLPDGNAIELNHVLTPRKVLDDHLDLSGSHVSMMACVSGLSREGVGGDALGMEWAMIQAGASSVLSTHWNISAKLAADFLQRFYEQWLGKQQPRRGALTTTIASLKAAGGRGGETESWAAFSLTGDWR
jgi:hypothetical protein